MEALAEAGVAVVGENRAQDLEAKHARYRGAFRWHFIGHLQSRKAKTVNAICELCHSLDSESAARRLTIPTLVEVNLSGEPTKSGVTPEELPRFVAEYPDVRGALDDLDDELRELKEAIDAAGGEPPLEAEPDLHVFEELGDVLFAAVNVARRLNVNPELALRATSRRFRDRVERAEERAAANGEAFRELSLEAKDAYFDQAKEEFR